MAFPPRKTIVGPLGRSPIVTRTSRTATTPIKTLVGSTVRPPVKTQVGNLAAPRPKTLVGNLAAPPPKTTPANLGKGGTKPLGMPAADRGAIQTTNPISSSRSFGMSDGNPGRSVSPMPKPAGGPVNPTFDFKRALNDTSIQDGGMGPTAKRMGRAPSRGSRTRRSAFFGE